MKTTAETFCQTVDRYIVRQRLLDKGRLHIVALSGGADSVALLLVMKALGYHIEAAHCNFHLRGEESNRDEQFVAKLCQQQDVALHRIHFDTQTYATLHRQSIEMAARELRYSYFRQLRQDIDAASICVAHHINDSVETLLINLVRGTGIHGLTGIRPRQGYIRRPLLCVSRQQTEDFLAACGQPYVTDSSNLVDDVVRNKFRLNIIPQLQAINPAAVQNIWATARHLAEAEAVYNAAIDSQLSAITAGRLPVGRLLGSPSPQSLLFEWLQGFSFSSATIEQIFASLQAQTGRLWSSPTHELIIDRGDIVVEEKRPPVAPMVIPETGCYVIGSGLRFTFAVTQSVKIDKSASCACLDAQKVAFPLTVRPAQEGDRFVPYGMNGSRLVSDYLTDRKLSLFDRRRQLVITDAAGRIVWLVGQRTDQRFCVDETTASMLVCKTG